MPQLKLANTCTRCLLHLTRHHIVWGLGNTNTIPIPVMLIGEGPGKQEDNTGRPFIGKSGRELDLVCARVGLPPDSMYITNVIKCRCPENRDPEPAELAACSRWLQQEIAQLRPRIIATVGAIATREFLPGSIMPVVHGRVFDTTYADMPCVVVPVYHPAAGLHNPAVMHNVQADFKILAQAVLGNIEPEPAPGTLPPEPVDYYEVTTTKQLANDLASTTTIAIDTETMEVATPGVSFVKSIPWCLTYSTRPHAAGLIRATSTELLQHLNAHVSLPTTTTIMHSALFDLPILEQMDIYPGGTLHDTIIMSYLLQCEPLGLKQLAARYCYMLMRTYTAVVAPAIRLNAMSYLAAALDHDWPDVPEILEYVKGKPKVKKPWSVAKRIERILMDDHFKGANPRERWLKIQPHLGRANVEMVLGRMLMGNLGQIPFPEALNYACADADATFMLYPILRHRLEAYNGLMGAYRDDIGVIPMASDMQKAGMRVNRGRFEELTELFEGKRAKLDDEINIAVQGLATDETITTSWPADTWFNPGSHPDMRKLLYKILKLPPIKRTATGLASTSEDVLPVYTKNPTHGALIQKNRDWRGYEKLISTYSKPVIHFIQPDSRVHPNIRLTNTATGRLSTFDPNLMAQPVRSEEGRKIRSGFVASPGCVLVSSDYSQIELRMMAHESQDPTMLEVFHKGQDIHSRTASEIFGIPMDQLSKYDHRRPAKTVNFLIPYGGTEMGLHETLMADGADAKTWTVARCKEFIAEWFALYPGVKAFMARVQQQARRYGYVTDMWGRIRLTPGVRAADKYIVEKTLREAGNMPIQSGAQGVIKKAMGKLNSVYKQFRNEGWHCWPLLQIHDDILSEVEIPLIPIFIPIVAATMEHVVKLSVPIPVDPEIGLNWGALGKYTDDRLDELYELQLSTTLTNTGG